ncbi:tagatose-bisphosphate aldolase [Enterococcus ureasiticus]|uniref:Tagatose 1,6-diphosphate aldolase n=1 Tax=Enterococcus ureasiticus TaxID=903984 RepID=A0A1E5GD18_9ENTE|nr:tagatose-bisphosphate aldolase [Enterococcus ureasiticus]OEG10150.1 tagatose-bisphosphate aldolase [Enterococcus ureasiticus]
MLKITANKKAAMDRLSTKNGIIEALAIDQRGALKKMIKALGKEPTEQHIIDFKTMVSKELTPFASAILLDPEYGIVAAEARDQEAGLLLAYEKTGYDATTPGRLPDLLEDWSALRLREKGADAVKFLLYYDADEPQEINHLKHVFIERLGSECVGEDIPFYLELVSYDANITDATSSEYAKIKPEKVIKMMKEFSKPRYNVDVLKVEVPVNMNYVEGIGTEKSVYSRAQALSYFKQQSEATLLPFIFLSAGVTAKMFQDTLEFAKEAGSTFNGVLCGRATWKEGVAPFIEKGEQAGCQWLSTVGKEHIQQLNEVVERTASSWHDKVEVLY